MEKINWVCALPRYPETTWTMFFHRYRDNGHEETQARELADRYKLKFVSIPAIFMVLEKFVEKRYTEADLELISHLWETPEEATATMKRTKDCVLWKQASIDANGDLFLCQLLYEERFKLCNFLNTPWPAIKKMMQTHDFCKECLKCGGNQYQLCYAPPATSKDPVGEANKKRRIW